MDLPLIKWAAGRFYKILTHTTAPPRNRRIRVPVPHRKSRLSQYPTTLVLVHYNLSRQILWLSNLWLSFNKLRDRIMQEGVKAGSRLKRRTWSYCNNTAKTIYWILVSKKCKWLTEETLQSEFLIKKQKAKEQHLSVIHLWWEEWIKLHIQVGVGESKRCSINNINQWTWWTSSKWLSSRTWCRHILLQVKTTRISINNRHKAHS